MNAEPSDRPESQLLEKLTRGIEELTQRTSSGHGCCGSSQLQHLPQLAIKMGVDVLRCGQIDLCLLLIAKDLLNLAGSIKQFGVPSPHFHGLLQNGLGFLGAIASLEHPSINL
jgi:hypothetical protein